MGFDQNANKVDLPLKAAADLRTHQYKFVKLDANGNVVLCSAAGERVLGILQNKPNTGETAAVRIIGISKIVCSGACDSARPGWPRVRTAAQIQLARCIMAPSLFVPAWTAGPGAYDRRNIPRFGAKMNPCWK